MTDNPGDLADADPNVQWVPVYDSKPAPLPFGGKPRTSLFKSPLSDPPLVPRHGVLDALAAHDAWVHVHGDQLRGTRAGDAPVVTVVESVVAEVAVVESRVEPETDNEPVVDLDTDNDEDEPDEDEAPMSLGSLGIQRAASEPAGSTLERMRAMLGDRGLR